MSGKEEGREDSIVSPSGNVRVRQIFDACAGVFTVFGFFNLQFSVYLKFSFSLHFRILATTRNLTTLCRPSKERKYLSCSLDMLISH